MSLIDAHVYCDHPGCNAARPSVALSGPRSKMLGTAGWKILNGRASKRDYIDVCPLHVSTPIEVLLVAVALKEDP